MDNEIIINDDVNFCWTVEKICGFKVEERNGVIIRMYLVKWLGYDEMTWEPFENFSNSCKDMVKEFINTHINQVYPS